jgi:hypothetical protein
MATIYNVPKGLEHPIFNWKEVQKYRNDIKDHENRLREWVVKRCIDGGKPTKHVGEVIKFPVADGYAEYMVACMKPLQLIHLEYYDGYSFEYANRLKAKDVEDKINQQNALKKLFTAKKEG